MANSKPNQTALITGGSSGIGLEIAKQFVKNNYNVIIVSDNEERLNNAVFELKNVKDDANVGVIVADLSQPESAEQIFQETNSRGIEVNILVNNAGVGVYGEFGQDTDLNQELSMIQLNVNSVVQLTKLYLPQMLQRSYGKILITASIASLTSSPLLTVYAATKAFDYIFAMGLREEVKNKGVTVTALLPGATDTNFFNRAGANDTEVAQDKENLADPEDVAEAAFEALIDGKDHVIVGFKNKLNAVASHFLPQDVVAKQSKLKHASK